MALARGALLTAYFATLFYAKTPAPAVAFNLPLGEARSQQFFKRSSMVFSQSLSMESEPRQDSSPKLGAAGRRRARDIVTLTRRRSRATARQTRSPAKAPYQEPRSQVHIQQRTRGEISPMLEASRREGVQSRPPSPAASPQEGSSGGELTKSLKVEAPAEKQRRVGKDVDWMRRRVQEILEEYSRKAPTAEQWPPGRRIRVRGVDIHYKDTGSRGRGKVQGAPKDRPVFMCLHGLAGSTASWDEVITDLSEYGRVISFDRPGFGKTERVMPFRGLPWRLSPQTLGENPYSSDFAAKVMFGLLDRLGVDKIILVAHSLGAQVALRAARTRPDMVRAMVLVAPAVLNPLDTKFVMGRDPNANLFSPIVNLRTRVEITAKLAAFNLQLLQPGETPLETVRNITLRGDVEERVQRNFHDRSLPSDRPELISKYIEPLRDPLWDRGLLHFYKSLQGEVQPGEQLLQKSLDVWKGPSMVITGDNDPTVPTQSSVYVAEAMEGRLVVVETCAHIPMDEKSEVFSSAVLSFADSEEVRNAWVAGGNSTNSW